MQASMKQKNINFSRREYAGTKDVIYKVRKSDSTHSVYMF